MFGRILTLVTLAALIMVSLVLQSTTPVDAGPVGILAVFFLLYIITVGVTTWMLHTLGKVRLWLSETMRLWSSGKEVLSLKKSYYYASVLGFLPVMLIGLQSVGSVGVYEVMLVLLFVAIGIFYIKKRTA